MTAVELEPVDRVHITILVDNVTDPPCAVGTTFEL